jgi:hypothetical protein
LDARKTTVGIRPLSGKTWAKDRNAIGNKLALAYANLRHRADMISACAAMIVMPHSAANVVYALNLEATILPGRLRHTKTDKAKVTLAKATGGSR